MLGRLSRLIVVVVVLRADLLDNVRESLHVLTSRAVHASPMVRSNNHRLVMVLSSFRFRVAYYSS